MQASGPKPLDLFVFESGKYLFPTILMLMSGSEKLTDRSSAVGTLSGKSQDSDKETSARTQLIWKAL